MLYYLLLPFNLVIDFINLGGVVLLVLFFVAFYMWILISERLYFYKYLLDEVVNKSFNEYKNLVGQDEWLNSKLKNMSLADINLQKNRNLNQIKGLVALCPLLGLLGTVIGMIEVFDVMAFTGTGNPRLMAGGISKATLPTMTGLVISITGLFAITFIERFINDRVLKKVEIFRKMIRRKKRIPEDSTIDITPMLDIVFIMLIFFIVTTTFIKETGVEVNRPNASTAVADERGNILIAITENNEIWIDKRMIDIRAVRANVERLKAENPEGSVIIKADENSKTGLLVETMDQVRLAGVQNVSIAADKE